MRFLDNNAKLYLTSFFIAISYKDDARKWNIIFEHLIYVHHVTISATATFNVVKLIRLTKLPMR